MMIRAFIKKGWVAFGVLVFLASSGAMANEETTDQDVNPRRAYNARVENQKKAQQARRRWNAANSRDDHRFDREQAKKRLRMSQAGLEGNPSRLRQIQATPLRVRTQGAAPRGR